VLLALLISEIEQRELPLLPFGEGSVQWQKEQWGAELFMQTLWQTVSGSIPVLGTGQKDKRPGAADAS